MEPVTAHQRVEAYRAQGRKVRTCARCGGEFFQEVQFNRYDANQYSSMPGANISAIDDRGIPILVCLCGEPQDPGMVGAASRALSDRMREFDVQLKKSRDARGKLGDLLKRGEALLALIDGKIEENQTKVAEQLNTFRAELDEAIQQIKTPPVVLNTDRRSRPQIEMNRARNQKTDAVGGPMPATGGLTPGKASGVDGE